MITLEELRRPITRAWALAVYESFGFEPGWRRRQLAGKGRSSLGRVRARPLRPFTDGRRAPSVARLVLFTASFATQIE
jgi:hypothetical protein